MVYWHSKHAGKKPPSRADLDPISEIPALVRHLILMDVLPDGYRYRLVGSEVAARTGRDQTGRYIDREALGPSLFESWVRALDGALRDREPRLLKSRLVGEAGAAILTLVLPLISRDGRPEMILGGCFFEGVADPPLRPNVLEAIDIAGFVKEQGTGSPVGGVRPVPPRAWA